MPLLLSLADFPPVFLLLTRVFFSCHCGTSGHAGHYVHYGAFRSHCQKWLMIRTVILQRYALLVWKHTGARPARANGGL